MDTAQHIISTEDGRVLRVSEAGRFNGVPILVQRGTPQSQLLYRAWIEDAWSQGIRLIGYERPGYGESTAQPGRTVASAANDVAAIARELGIERLAVWGISGGGPHALACAALLPGLVAAAAVLGSSAPHSGEGLDYFSGMGESNVAEFKAALQGRHTCEEFIEAEASELLHADVQTIEHGFHSLLCPVDSTVLTTDFAEFVVRSVHEGIRETRQGWVDDQLAFTTHWGFELTDIRVPVLVMHGAQDQFVPLTHGKWLANNILHAEVRLLPDDGHLSLAARRIPDVHAWLLNRM